MFLIKNAIFVGIVSVVQVCLANSIINSDKVELNKVNFACVKNQTCAKQLANEFIGALNKHKTIEFGAFSIEPTEDAAEKTVEGRSSKFSNLLTGNLIKIPFGAYHLTIQKSSDYENYFEFAIARKIEGRGRERKQMRFFVPAFLVMSQVGWWILAIAGVKVLALKAFVVSKFALIVAAIMTIKRLFEHVHSFPSHYYEHPEPMIMPYNFDFNSFNSPAHPNFDINEFHPSLPLNSGHEQTAALHHSGALGAETAVNNVVHNVTGGASGPGSSSSSSGLGNFATVARHPLNYNFVGKNPSFPHRKP